MRRKYSVHDLIVVIVMFLYLVSIISSIYHCQEFNMFQLISILNDCMRLVNLLDDISELLMRIIS